MSESESASEETSPDEEILTSVEEIRQALIDARKSDVFRELQHYYDSQSVFDIVGVSRREKEHTWLLAWLFDPDESHGLGTEPLRRLLEAVVVVENKGQQETLNPNVRDRIVTGSYRIRSPELTTEKPLNGSQNGRADLFVEGNIEPPSAYRSNENRSKEKRVGGADIDSRRFRLLIENKVESDEHDGQTTMYYNWLKETEDEGTLDVPLFLTPISTLELNELEEPECDCKQFIQINYQYLLDYVIVPCLQQDLGSQARWILKEYSQALSSSTNTENSAMALGNDERELLNEFLNENRALFKSIMRAISEDESRSEDEREAASKYVEASKDHSDVRVLVEGEERTFPYKSDTGHEVVKLLLKHDLVDNETFAELRSENTTGRPLLKRRKDMKGDEFERRYRTNEDQEIVYSGDIFYASSQWTATRVREFDKVLKGLFPDAQIRIELV